MDKYTIYCSTEQVEKALELGAPIKMTLLEGNQLQPIQPTAEQMVGWLETQGILIDIHFYYISWDIGVRTKTEDIIFREMAIDSRKKAVILAIDAALDYLIKAKEE